MGFMRRFSSSRKSKRQESSVNLIADSRDGSRASLAAVKETVERSTITQPNEQVRITTNGASQTSDDTVRDDSDDNTTVSPHDNKTQHTNATPQEPTPAIPSSHIPQELTEEKSKQLNGSGTIDGSLQTTRRTSLLSKTSDYNPLTAFQLPPRKKLGSDSPASRQDVEDTFDQFAGLIHSSHSPLPSQKGSAVYSKSEEQSGLIADLKHLGLKDIQTLRKLLEQRRSGEPQDDRKYLMEQVISLTAALPEHSKNRVELTSQFLGELWNTEHHPPQSYLGDAWRYRSADGSRNNYTLPMLGAANTPYARTVNPATVTPAALPDPFLVFDSLMAREEFTPNPNRVSSVFFNFASIVIHDLFQTDHKDPSISKTSSYLDLSVLYGDVQEDQDKMRTFKDGKIKPDCFAEERLLAFPPTAGVMLIMLNRYHNYVVEQMAMINEGGRFTKPSDDLPEPRKSAAWKKYDEDLFQTGRLVTCSLYINIILYDYLRTIVNLNRVNSTWTLDPRLEKRKHFGEGGTPRGVGNQVSAEFALCYRWHAPIGQLDEEWTDEVYVELFGKRPEEVDMKELMIGLAKYDHELPDDPVKRPFAHLKRGPDGKFNDDDLAPIMINATEQVAGAFGARNTPKSMRAISVLGMLQARQWNMCTLNEFREFFGLKRFNTFEEINSDPYVAEQLKNLYEHPDYVELYPGIMIEEAKTPMVPGVGICPNHTLARAVLSDAVALVRGDRFYTIDYNPKNLTQWGWNESNYDLGINQGCVLYKLFTRTLPNHFKPDSIYAHYPMTVPDENAKIMKDLGRFYDYNWERPTYIKPKVQLKNYFNVRDVLQNANDFPVMWKEGLGNVLGPAGEKFCLAGDTTLHRTQRESLERLVYRDQWHRDIKEFYKNITQKLVAEKSVKIAGINQVDIIKDVGNLVQVHFAAEMFAFPLKTEQNPKGVFTEHELWMTMSVISRAIFSDIEPTKTYPLRQVSQKLATLLGNIIEANTQNIVNPGLTSMFFERQRETGLLAGYGTHMIKRLAETGMSNHDIAFSQILPMMVAMIPNLSQAFAYMIDYYLGDGQLHWPEIQKLAEVDTTETDGKLLAYVQEGIRLNGTFSAYRRAGVDTAYEENGKRIPIQYGDKILCNLVEAARDPSIFPNPNEVVLDRNPESYFHFGFGNHSCLGRDASEVALTAMLRTVAKLLPNYRRAPGPQGQLKKVPRGDGFYYHMTERQDSYFIYPYTMKIHYSGSISDVMISPADVPKSMAEFAATMNSPKSVAVLSRDTRKPQQTAQPQDEPLEIDEEPVTPFEVPKSMAAFVAASTAGAESEHTGSVRAATVNGVSKRGSIDAAIGGTPVVPHSMAEFSARMSMDSGHRDTPRSNGNTSRSGSTIQGPPEDREDDEDWRSVIEYEPEINALGTIVESPPEKNGPYFSSEAAMSTMDVPKNMGQFAANYL